MASAPKTESVAAPVEVPDHIEINRVFHDHECVYYDERFAIVHDERSARQAVAEVEGLIGRRLRAGERVLDAGCGTGWFAAGVRRARPDVLVLGSDLSTGMLGKAREAGAWPLVQGDCTTLPFADGSIDVVVARGVLHHLPEVVPALAEWRRVLAPDGVVALSSEPTPIVEAHGAVLVKALLALLRRPLTAEEDFWEVASMAANLHVFTLDQLGAMCRDAGYREVALRTEDLVSTLVLTASYVSHGRRPGLARRVPWRALEALGSAVDHQLVHRVVPQRYRHTIVGLLRP